MRNNFSKTFKRSVTAAAVALTLSAAMPAMADNVNGAIKGTLTTQSGTSLAGATIVVTNKSNGYNRTLTADAEGRFDLKVLPVGKYDISVSQSGFETAQIKDVTIGVGKTAFMEIPLSMGEVETITVVGGTINVVDVSVSESSFNISAEELELLPISRSLTSVALLAPGTVKGDSRFGNLASFGGSSVAENVYYVNGLNMTNFRNGVGGANVPFSAYESFQVKTGGYSAEFGRATGGVISGVTKSGTNDFKFGVEAIYTPDSLSENKPDSVYRANDCNAEGECRRLIGDLFVNNQDDSSDDFEANLYASGAIIEDTLFFYGVYRHRDFSSENVNRAQSQSSNYSDDDPYYLARLDWNINEDHQLMLWTFSDERTYETTPYDADANGDYTVKKGTSFSERGGKSYAARYTGYLTDDLIMSAMVGRVEFTDTDRSAYDDCPVGYDADIGEDTTCYVNFTVGSREDTRDQYRVDFEWTLNDEHTLRFGYDGESNTARDVTELSGGIYYRYESFDAGASLPNGYTFADAARTTRVRNYSVGGEFDINNWSIYLEDQWDVTENLRLNLGLRSDSFENLNAEGDEFIAIDNQLAPRLGLSWDVNGDGESKVYASLGRYFIPVAANTNVRLAGGELYTHDYYTFEGLNSEGLPNSLGTKLGDTVVYGDGTTQSADTLVDKDIKPMYNDELIIGYQGAINDDWTWGIKGTRRILGEQIDDGAVESVDGHFILFNPGRPARFNYDLDGDGTNEEHIVSADDLGYPDAERKYSAIDVKLERAFNDGWMVNLTYTWSKSYGNAEGYVKSDNGQDDAGLTTDWDYPNLMDGAYGNLPSDRRHNIKGYAAFSITDNLRAGINMNIASGRPWTALGAGYTPDQSSYHYGDTYWVGDKRFSRGEMGRTPWTFNLDLNMTYTAMIQDSKVRFAVDVFNVFNASNPVRYDEIAEVAVGDDSASFGLPLQYQTPRSIQFTMAYDF